MHMYNFLCSDSLLYFFLFLSTLHGVYTRDCSCTSIIITSKHYSVGRANASSTWAVLHYCANSLSRLRLRVARLYLHCGISH